MRALLISTVVAIGVLTAASASSQVDYAEWLACADLMGPVVSCPPPPPPTVCEMENGALIRVMESAPGADAAGSVINLHIECGERLEAEVITRCAMVTAYNERDGLVSEIVSRSYPIDGCVTVPEPEVWLLLAFGVLGLTIAGSWKSRGS